MTSGASATRCAACRRMTSALPSPHRWLNRTLWPSVQPNCCNSCWNAENRTFACASSAVPWSTPIRRIRFGCCARAANGHQAKEKLAEIQRLVDAFESSLVFQDQNMVRQPYSNRIFANLLHNLTVIIRGRQVPRYHALCFPSGESRNDLIGYSLLVHDGVSPLRPAKSVAARIQ